jgi:hypothetical protein
MPYWLRAAASIAFFPLAPALADQPIDVQSLAAITGGQSVRNEIVTEQNLNARSENNQIAADIVETGAIVFEQRSLEGFNGIGNFVLNTGNNNVLQGSIAVTVFTAAP